MVPKYRGDSDDWLDNEAASRKHKKGSKPAARAAALPYEDANAVVAEVFPKLCRVHLDEGGSLLCSYRWANVVGKTQDQKEARERTPVAVGDRVLVRKTGTDQGVIDGICVRKNSLSRPAPGRDTGRYQHVLAANVERLAIIASVQEPLFSLGLVDRFLIAAEAEKIPTVLCVTKLDLMSPSQEKPWGIYQQLGYSVLEVSAKQGLGIDQLRTVIENQTVVFCGQSGVGKTSLLRILTGNPDLGRIGAVNEQTGKGRHTTTGAMMIRSSGQSKWIDTPGVKEFGLGQMQPENLASCFPEMKGLICEQPECLHLDEPGCSAKGLLRYPSYRRILESLMAGEG